MPDETLVFVGTNVPADLANALRKLADESERSVAAELRLAIRGHLEAAADRKAAA
jgi:hypothetical protein